MHAQDGVVHSQQVLSDAREKLKQAQEKVAVTTGKVERSQQALGSYTKQLEQLETEFQDIKPEPAATKEKFEEWTRALRQVSDGLVSSQQDLASSQQDLMAFTQQLVQAQEQVDQSQQEQTGIHEQLEQAKKLSGGKGKSEGQRTDVTQPNKHPG